LPGAVCEVRTYGSVRGKKPENYFRLLPTRFAAHDYNAIQLVKKSEEWNIGLDNVQSIQMYELLFYLYKAGVSDKKNLKILCKYQYYLTKKEKSINLEWGKFVERMEELYPINFIQE
jgi:hypothetical protein